MPDLVQVPVKPATQSKINWTQVVAIASTVLALVGFDLDASEQVAVVTAIQVVSNLVTMVFRTWFNKSVTP